MSMLQKLAWATAVMFLAIGIMGFIPAFLNDENELLGLFHVDATHNVIHILSGVLAAAAAMSSAMLSKRFFQAMGVVYGLVMIIGFIQGDTVLGLFDVNMEDNYLHLAFTVIFLAIGFGVKDEGESTMS